MLLTDVCLSRTSGLSREQRGLGKPKFGKEVAHVTLTQTPLSRSEGQGHHDTLLSVALTREAGAAVGVGAYSAWETTAIRCVCSGRPRGRRGAGAYRVATRTACW